MVHVRQYDLVKKKVAFNQFVGISLSHYVVRGHPNDVVYLDFQKAFDKVMHKRLMPKIKSLGIKHNIFNWIEDWLKDRVQRVVLLGNHSQQKEVREGVPQGSVLGTLLFLIYKNDIEESVCISSLKFADDTKVFSVVSDINDVKELQTDLMNLCIWFEDWLMLFNVDQYK